MIHRIEGRRAAPPSGPARGKTFVVAGTPDVGTEFDGHANEFASKVSHDPDRWIFRAPQKGEGIVFDRNGTDETRVWNGRRWRKIEDAPELADLPADATRADIVVTVNALIAALRAADVLDDPSASLRGRITGED